MWKYTKTSVPNATLTTAYREVNLYGCKAQITITTYSVDSTLAITYGLKPVGKSVIVVSHGEFSERRNVEQVLVAHAVSGNILDPSDVGLQGMEVFEGRTISDAALQYTASMVESVRLSIRKNIGKLCRDKALALIGTYYNEPTHKTVNSLLREVNWPFMLASTQILPTTLQVVQTTMENNFPDWFQVGFDGETNIRPARFSINHGSLADMKATALLGHVCGKQAQLEFQKEGHIIVKNQGYKFKVAPGQWVDAWDPKGNHASLCIHTRNFSCNPIDELVVAWLHIKHKLVDYLKTANFIGGSKGFIMPEEKK